MSSERLQAIALISGGKDSFFSLLHCISHGHRVVALANLYPVGDDGMDSGEVRVIDPDQPPEHLASLTARPDSGTNAASGPGTGASADAPLHDLNSFMYQTVGHEVVPLYAAATGLPLYRQPIIGGAVRHERDYDYAAADTAASAASSSSSPDETESMLSLLQAIKARHPEANAVCAGAILSTYQRTRVESIALRLGLVPLAYLWKYPILPHPASKNGDETQLLRDMATAGLEARIIKVASAGLDEAHLWERVTSDAGAARVKRALTRFGAAEGAALGEGGEFETIVLDGPAHLFKRRISVPDDGRTVVREGGGSNWLMIRGAHLLDKKGAHEDDNGDDKHHNVTLPTPDLLDTVFAPVFKGLSGPAESQPPYNGITSSSSLLKSASPCIPAPLDITSWTVSAAPNEHDGSVEAETRCVVDKIKQRLSASSLTASQITTVAIILRDMSAFPKVNSEYGKLFTRPNPPSRVTISCGDLLPEGSSMVMYLTVPTQPKLGGGGGGGGGGDRSGLHVQSRSYWAPANIGPYSQAIGVPVVSQGKSMGLRSVFVAGQIPLIPATMELPTPSDTSLMAEVVLSLQHLWRIGAEMGIQIWTSSVAYFSRASSEADMQQRAQHAGRAWKQIHAAPDDEDDENAEDTVDPWDLKYNPQYASLAGAGKRGPGRRLPDWSVYTLRQQNEPVACIPPFFAVEVESLPRASTIEWHAHVGLSGLEDSSVELVQASEFGASGWRACHMIARTTEGIFMHTVVSCTLKAAAVYESWESLVEALVAVHNESLRKLETQSLTESSTSLPYTAYVDTVSLQAPWSRDAEGGPSPGFAIIPCRSIWSIDAERIGCIGLYRTALSPS